MTRCCVYIDGPNLFHAGESIGVRIDYSKFKEVIIGKRDLTGLTFYNTFESKPGEVNFHSKIQSLGYKLKLVRLHRYGSERPEEKVINCQIVADSLVDAFEDRFDVAIFCSGDKDLLPSIEYLMKKFKKQVEVVGFRHSIAWDLRKSGAKILDLTRISDQIRRI